ncbi:hypothetical protein ACFL3V_01500 [Nanoarchaeota archaeon]
MVSEQIRINLKKKNLLMFVVILLFLVLVIPTFVRFYQGNDSLIGSEPYYHFRAARELLQVGEYNPFDAPEDISDMSHSPRDYSFNPYHYLLVYASKIVSLPTASRILPLILGMLSIFLFNLLLKLFIEEDYKRKIILILLVMNPAFIYTFTVSTPHSAAIALTLLGTFFFTRKGLHNLILSVFCLAIVSFFSLFNTLLAILLLLAYILTKKELQNRFIIVVFLLALFSFAKRTSFFYNYTYTPTINIVGNLFSDLGGILGFGIFSVILAIYGVASNWRRKSDFILFFVLSLMLISALLFAGNMPNMYLMFFVAIAAGIGFVKLYELQWSVTSVKNLALLILVCGLMFSTVSYMTRLASMEPDKNTIESLSWMGSNTFKNGFVLSHYDYGYMISTVARNPVVADSLSASGYDQQFFYKVQDSMFYGRELKETRQLFDVYNIDYVYITPEMKSGKVWRRSNEGLLFLFTNNRTFKNIYDKDGFEVWEAINTTVAK